VDYAQVKSKIELNRLKRIPEGKGIRYEADEKAYLPKSLKLGVDWENLRENRFRQTKYQRLDGQLPSPTIMTHRHNYYHPTEHRFLTQREAARLQSFPNDFVFTGPVSAQWRQIGNAVPPLLGKALGQKILELYKEATGSKKTEKAAKVKRIQDGIHEIRGQAFHYKEVAKAKRIATTKKEEVAEAF
jgi:DNA (cytosine-5)-methyltransferase 1